MAANQAELGSKIAEGLKPMFADLGLALDSFVVENLSLPDELQKMLDQRIGMNMIGDMDKYTQFQVAQSMPIAAANEGGGAAGIGVGLGAGMRHGADHDERDEAGRSSRGSPRQPRRPAPAAPRLTRSSAPAAEAAPRAERSSAPNCGTARLPTTRRNSARSAAVARSNAIEHVRLRMDHRSARLRLAASLADLASLQQLFRRPDRRT